ncbi:MAG: gas vesicle protein [Pseudomonadota bacterium]
MSGQIFQYADPSQNEQTLVDVLDRVLDVGVVLQGDLTISVADVDLLYIGLKAILCTPDRLEQLHADQSKPIARAA